MKRYELLLIFLIPFAIQGCATLNKDECQVADWEAIGYEDGSRGSSLPDQFGKHRKACAKHGIQADYQLYKLGHDKGIRRYCTPEQGFLLGKNNIPFPKSCPNDLVTAVRDGYRAGHAIFKKKQALTKEIRDLESKKHKLDQEIISLDEERQEHEKYLAMADAELVNPNTSNTQKVIIYAQRRKLKKMIGKLDDDIESLESSKARYTNSIEALKNKIQMLDNQPMRIMKK